MDAHENHPTVASHQTRLDDGTEVATYLVEPPVGRDHLGDVVICHGTPWSARMWLPLARELGRDHRVFLWDMPGYGDSIAEAAVPVDLITQRQRFAELLDRWELERPHVIAHDIGGAVALGAHLLEDREFASLYLLDIVTLPPWGSPFFRLVAQNESVFAALPPNLHQALVREYIAGAAHTPLTRAQIDVLAAPWCTTAGQSAFYRQVASLSPEQTEPIVDRLGEVRCPVRIGWGKNDPWIPVEQSRRLAQALPGTPEVTHFPRVGHLVPFEASEDLRAGLESWLHA